MTEQKETTSTIEQLQATKDERRRSAAETYRVLLERNDHPEPNDAATLLGVLAVLGRTSDDLVADLEIVRALVECEDAERRAQKLEGPCQKARRKSKDTVLRIAKEREESERRWRDELGAAEMVHSKIAAARQSLAQLVGQLQHRRDEWAALVEGLPIAEVIAARRAARKATATKPEPPTREQVIADAEREMVTLRYKPAVGSACDRVNAMLAVQGYAPLTEDEIRLHEIQDWSDRR